jgi:orotate phosphoribosyltransferase-like protein
VITIYDIGMNLKAKNRTPSQTLDLAREVMRLRSKGMSCKAIGMELNISESYVSQLVRRKKRLIGDAGGAEEAQAVSICKRLGIWCDEFSATDIAILIDYVVKRTKAECAKVGCGGQHELL